MSRKPATESFDLIVVGGGITGAGVARDAALRGLTCLLLEKDDFGSGTSSRTSHLVHGGLPYLRRSDLAMVAECLRERDLLLQMAPHLIQPLPILLPVYQGDRRRLWQVRVGLGMYDLMSLGKGTPHYTVLNRRGALRRAPHLPPAELRGAGLFYDYQIAFPERLLLESLFSAREYGAHCLNYQEVTAIAVQGESFRVTARDRFDGSEQSYRARVVVNATGPWADLVSSLYSTDLGGRLQPAKGVHVLVDADLDQAFLAPVLPEGRLLFCAPLHGMALVGATESDWQGDPDEVAASAEDVETLLAGLARLLPGAGIRPSDALWTMAGVRPLARSQRRGTSRGSRRHQIFSDGPGGRFVTVVGGTYTTFRKMAEDTLDLVCRSIKHPVAGTTDRVPLFGGGLRDRVLFRENMCECTQKIPNLQREVVDHLVGLYGRRCSDVIDLGLERPELRERVTPEYPDFKVQVVYAIRNEDAHHLDDVILRRLRMGLSHDRGLSGAPAVAQLMAAELGWNEATVRQELESFKLRVQRTLL